MDAQFFADWLNGRMRIKNWSQSELARISGLTRQAINNYLSAKVNKPDEDALKALAHAFDLPPEEIFRAAGILPPNHEKPPGLEEWVYLYMTASESERQEMLEYAHFKKQRRPVNSRSG
jgi:transcriptional regulator with XRE-family HTH domain